MAMLSYTAACPQPGSAPADHSDVSLPPVPADLAADCAIAAALVRAGAPTVPPVSSDCPPSAARCRRRRQPAAAEVASPAGPAACRDRLLAQLGERTRAADRTARRLAQARRDYDRATTLAARAAAEAVLDAAAIGHERALAAARALARRVGDLLTAPDPAAALAGRGRAR
ncbi:MAG: hypothetical protein IT340_18115 [Chloroflexi bacterium]|nr:hypothetical protein [Chloroflexota bacterium]